MIGGDRGVNMDGRVTPHPSKQALIRYMIR